MVAQLFAEVGLEILPAASVAEAHRQLDAFDVQAAVVDAAPAEGRGWSELRALKEKLSPVPVGLASAQVLDPAEVATLGFDFLLQKPYGADQLFTEVANAVRWRPVTARERSLAVAYFAALSAKDWPALGAVCTDDVRYCLPGTNPFFSRVVTGRKALLEYGAALFRDHPESHFEVVELLALPDMLVARCHNTWTENGEQREHSSSLLLGVRDDRIASIGVRIASDAFNSTRDPDAYELTPEGAIRRRDD